TSGHTSSKRDWSSDVCSSEPPGSPNPGHPAAAPGPQPGMAMPNPAPPRRRKPRTEPVAYAPVTGSLPLSRDDVTEIPADGPITWPKRSTGIIGVANLVA